MRASTGATFRPATSRTSDASEVYTVDRSHGRNRSGEDLPESVTILHDFSNDIPITAPASLGAGGASEGTIRFLIVSGGLCEPAGLARGIMEHIYVWRFFFFGRATGTLCGKG